MDVLHSLTLVADDLADLFAGARSARLPTLRRLLARGDTVGHAGIGPCAWYCRRFGIEPRQDWPVAALLSGVPATYWLLAEPVYLAVERDHLVMSAVDRLSDRESEELFAALSAHARGEALQMIRSSGDCWLLGCTQAQALRCTEPALVVGHDIHRFLPSGADAPRWLRLITEFQMLLHEHPVNRAREAHGQRPVNSLWLWGGGVLPSVPPGGPTVATRVPLLLALARSCAAPTLALGTNLAQTLSTAMLREVIVVPDDAVVPAAERALHWELNWFAPAWQALAGGRFDTLVLAGRYGDGMVELRIDRPGRWKFWRRRPRFPLLPVASA